MAESPKVTGVQTGVGVGRWASWGGAALLGLLVAVAIEAGPALAAEGGASRARTSQLAEQLQAADPAAVQAAIDALGERNEAAARAALIAFLSAGQPDAHADRAIAALGKRGAAQNLPALTEFTRHRRTSARAAAYAGISRIALPAADALLGAGLRDSDAAVRSLCAQRLGERAAYGQLELLFRAYERGVREAAFAVGKLVPAADVPRFEQQLGRLPIQTLLLGYEQLLLRPDIAEAQKLELIAHLGEVASPPVKRFLGRMRAHPAFAEQPRLLLAIAQTEGRIGIKPKSGAGTGAEAAPSTPAQPGASR